MNSAPESADELMAVLKENVKSKNYFFSKDEPFVKQLMDGLFENLRRYGYASCPCRLGTGIYKKDEDIICPCVYMESDIDKYGACFCALYVSADVYEGKKEISSIPESRPKEKIFSMTDTNQNEQNKETIWRCTVCGYEAAGENPPDKCPKCGAPKEAFVKKED